MAQSRIKEYDGKRVTFEYEDKRTKEHELTTFSAEAFIFYPGGFGTLDEFYELLTLIQTKKIERIPVILIGKDFWQPLLSWIENDLYARHGTVDDDDLKLYRLVNNIEEAFEIIKNSKERTELFFEDGD